MREALTHLLHLKRSSSTYRQAPNGRVRADIGGNAGFVTESYASDIPGGTDHFSDKDGARGQLMAIESQPVPELVA